jgi:CheY-like chemotaxis protein
MSHCPVPPRHGQGLAARDHMKNASIDGPLVLIVEGEALIALEIAQSFERAGARVVTARTLREAFFQVEHNVISGAILDHVFDSADVSVLCARLKSRGIPFVTYSTSKTFQGACHDGPHVSRLADPAVLVATLKRLFASGKFQSETPRTS